MNVFAIDDLLEQMVLEDVKHFAPHYICHRLNISDVEGVTNYLLQLVNRKLVVHYEVQCPGGHSDFIVTDPTRIPEDIRECHYCGEEYTPSRDNIWIAFDFTDYYKEHVKKKPSSQAGSVVSDQNTDNLPGVNLTTCTKLPAFKEIETLYSHYRIDLLALNDLLQQTRTVLDSFRDQFRKTWPKNKPKSVTSKDVGDALEQLAHYVFSCTNGIFVPKGPWANDMSQIDDVLYLTCHQCFLIDWKSYTIVECKNWSRPLDKQGVNDFSVKLLHTGLHVGIIFSREGVTGTGHSDAMGKLAIEASHGRIILVIDDNDLDRLKEGKNLFELLEQKYFERRLSSA